MRECELPEPRGVQQPSLRPAAPGWGGHGERSRSQFGDPPFKLERYGGDSRLVFTVLICGLVTETRPLCFAPVKGSGGGLLYGGMGGQGKGGFKCAPGPPCQHVT